MGSTRGASRRRRGSPFHSEPEVERQTSSTSEDDMYESEEESQGRRFGQDSEDEEEDDDDDIMPARPSRQVASLRRREYRRDSRETSRRRQQQQDGNYDRKLAQPVVRPAVQYHSKGGEKHPRRLESQAPILASVDHRRSRRSLPLPAGAIPGFATVGSATRNHRHQHHCLSDPFLGRKQSSSRRVQDDVQSGKKNAAAATRKLGMATHDARQGAVAMPSAESDTGSEGGGHPPATSDYHLGRKSYNANQIREEAEEKELGQEDVPTRNGSRRDARHERRGTANDRRSMDVSRAAPMVETSRPSAPANRRVRGSQTRERESRDLTRSLHRQFLDEEEREGRRQRRNGRDHAEAAHLNDVRYRQESKQMERRLSRRREPEVMHHQHELSHRPSYLSGVYHSRGDQDLLDRSRSLDHRRTEQKSSRPPPSTNPIEQPPRRSLHRPRDDQFHPPSYLVSNGPDPKGETTYNRNVRKKHDVPDWNPLPPSNSKSHSKFNSKSKRTKPSSSSTKDQRRSTKRKDDDVYLEGLLTSGEGVGEGEEYDRFYPYRYSAEEEEEEDGKGGGEKGGGARRFISHRARTHHHHHDANEEEEEGKRKILPVRNHYMERRSSWDGRGVRRGRRRIYNEKGGDDAGDAGDDNRYGETTATVYRSVPVHSRGGQERYRGGGASGYDIADQENKRHSTLTTTGAGGKSRGSVEGTVAKLKGKLQDLRGGANGNGAHPAREKEKQRGIMIKLKSLMSKMDIII